MLRAFLCAGLIVPSVAGASQPQPPQAVAASPWQVDFGDERCLAVRRFTVGAEKLTVGIQPDPDGEGARFIFRLEGKAPRSNYGYYPGVISSEGRKLDEGLTILPAAGNGLLLTGGVRDLVSDSLKTMRHLVVQSKLLSANVPLTAMEKVTPLLDECNAGLLESWGFSRADQQRLAVQPSGPIVRLFSTDDYPAEAQAKRQQGLVSVRYMVTVEGRAKNCVVRESSGSLSLDAATCAIILRRGRLTPARDKAGNKMEAPDFARIRWILPD